MLNKKGKDIAAYGCLKKALFLDPFRYDIHLNLGLLLLKYKKYVGAQLHFRSALKLNKNTQIYNLLAITLSELGDHNNAEKCYEELIKIGSAKKENINKYLVNYLCLLARKGD